MTDWISAIISGVIGVAFFWVKKISGDVGKVRDDLADYKVKSAETFAKSDAMSREFEKLEGRIDKMHATLQEGLRDLRNDIAALAGGRRGGDGK